MEEIRGAGVALVTPFNEDKSVDYNGLEKLLNHVVNGGVDYLVLMGTTGESTSLSKKERNEVVDFCKRINNHKLPIILGIGGSNTTQVVAEINTANLENISAILSVSPAYNKPSQEGIYQHYKKISESSPLPIIIYNVPGRTSSNISASTTVRLANDCKKIVAIKEASGNLDQIMSILKEKPSSFTVLSGDDGLTLPMIYMGAEGVISVIGQSHPKEFSDMISLALAGNIESANIIHYKLYNFYRPLYAEGNPVGIKSCLETLGICTSDVRLPLFKASKTIKNEIKELLNQ